MGDKFIVLDDCTSDDTVTDLLWGENSPGRLITDDSRVVSAVEPKRLP